MNHPPPDDLETPRLILRAITPAHKADMTAMNADPQVMRYFPAPLTTTQSDALTARIIKHQKQHGFSLMAVHLKEGGEFVGFTGLLMVDLAVPFAPAVEIGWRLIARHWGKALAPEAAQAVLADGFTRLGLREIVSFTAHTNLASQRVMEKIGMMRDINGDFDHPKLPARDKLTPHVLYRLTKSLWRGKL